MFSDPMMACECDDPVMVTFGVDGRAWEIQLCPESATELRQYLASYVRHARERPRLPPLRKQYGYKHPGGQVAAEMGGFYAPK